MYSEQAELLTQKFYEWEQRGRGWQLWNEPVYPEPPFVPFYFHRSVHTPFVDDGKSQTLLSSFADKIKNVFSSSSDEAGDNDLSFLCEGEEAIPVPFEEDENLIEIRVALPKGYKVHADYTEQCLLSMTLGNSILSFEIIGNDENIIIQFVCRAHDEIMVKQQIQAYFPEGCIMCHESSFSTIFNRSTSHKVAIVDIGLSEEFMRPIRLHDSFDPDPLAGILGVLDNLSRDEIGIVQVLFQAIESPWQESIMRSVMNYNGDSFFADAPEMVKLARNKCSSPLYAVNVRLIGKSLEHNRPWDIAKSLYACFKVFADPQSNQFIPLTNDGYDDDIHLDDVIKRQTHRTGMLLNTFELISLVHFPSASVFAKKLSTQSQKSQRVPREATGHKFIIGKNFHNGQEIEVSLSHEQRLKHMHIIGATGTGKSTLLLNLIDQDIQRGLGIAVFDPHGDLIESVLERIPESRHQDVIIFDPGDEEYPIGFNILEAKSDVEKNVLSSDLVEIFKRFSTSWGDQMSVVLGNAISALLGSNKTYSLLELRRILIEKEFRHEVLSGITDDHVRYFWEKEFPLLRGSALSSILTRLDFFLRPKLIRNIVAQKNGINLQEIVNNKKILLLKLSQGIIGDENAFLLGSLLVSKLHQVAMQRQLQNSNERTPFYLYIDEFQNFITPSMKAILSGARKYNLGLILAHQNVHQLLETDAGLANSLISNAGTRISFRIGEFDAQKLQSGFTHFDAEDMQNLSVGEAIVRVERSDYDFNLTTQLPRIIDSHIAQGNKESIIRVSRKNYNTKTNVVEGTPSGKRIYSMPVSPRGDSIPPKESNITSSTEILKHKGYVSEQKSLSYHRYLQNLIKKMAEQIGFKATIEEQIDDGSGRVDVGLERDGEKIACEISVTTNDEHEIKNIEKCLKSGYNKVLFCSPDKKRIELVKKQISGNNNNSFSHLTFLLPDELASYFDFEKATEVKNQYKNIVKGYRVKINYKNVSKSEVDEKQKIIGKVLLNSIKKIKGIH